MGLWKILEYERGSEVVKVWRFQSYNEADDFRRKREEFYGIIGLDKRMVLSKALPEISGAEIELFRRILQTPTVKRCDSETQLTAHQG